MGVGNPGCFFQFFLRRIGFRKPQVLRNRAMEEIGVLPYHRNVLSEVLEGQFFQVLAAEQYPSLLRVKEA